MKHPIASEELRTLALHIAEKAGSQALRRRRTGVDILGAKSSPEDLVTTADAEAEALIRREILRERPQDGILGEEAGFEPGTSGLTWIVDPIDGTVNYVYDQPYWAVSIAVVAGEPEPESWEGLAGAVVIPALGESYSAVKGGQAQLNGAPITVQEAASLELSLVATGFLYDAQRRVKQAKVLEGLIGKVRDMRRSGSAATDLCFLAAGRLNAYYDFGLKPWDHAAGAIIARAAGAHVHGPHGLQEDKDLLLAAHPSTYSYLKRLLEDTDGRH